MMSKSLIQGLILSAIIGLAAVECTKSSSGSAASTATVQAKWYDSSGNIYFPDVNSCDIRKITASTTDISLVSGTVGACASNVAADYTAPNNLALDSSGNIYVADYYNAAIRKIAPGGTVTTFAGTMASGGYTGDGGPATSATLNCPTDVAFDSAGNLYIAEQYNYVIRKVDKNTGKISTYAGSNAPGLSGDGGPATSAKLNYLYAIAFDKSDNLYIADTGNALIRRVDKATGIITTVAGTIVAGVGQAGFSGDGGPATSAELNYPVGIAIDNNGVIYVSDNNNNRIRAFTTGGKITTVVGIGTASFSGDGGLATAATISSPYGLALDKKGNLLIMDTGNQRIRSVTPSGVISTLTGNGTPAEAGDGGPASSAEIDIGISNC
jgi:sugar lactone lactonase YvrE